MIKFTIDQDGVKRQIEGPFDVCASREDFTMLRNRINQWLEGDAVYGWLYVVDQNKTVADNPPRKWKDDL